MLLQKLIFFLSLKVENLRESLPQDIKWIAGNLLLAQYKFHDVNFYSRVQILTMVQKDCGRSPTNLCQAEKSHFSLPTPLATTMEPRWKMDKSQRSFSTPESNIWNCNYEIVIIIYVTIHACMTIYRYKTYDGNGHQSEHVIEKVCIYYCALNCDMYLY